MKIIKDIQGYYAEMKHWQQFDNYPIAQEGLVYLCPLNFSKRHNMAMQQINKNYLKHIELSLPHILHVGVTTACNLHCPACPTGTRSLGRISEHLDFDLYRKAVDDLRRSLLFMLFWDWGEPFMHPKLTEMVRYAWKSQIQTVVSTNANVANSIEQIERFVDARPSVVIVCVDGANQSIYETYRTGGKLSNVIKTLKRLGQAKKKLGTLYPVVEFRSLATLHTEAQMADLLHLAEDTGANLFSVKTLRPYDYRSHNIDHSMVPVKKNLARYHYRQGQATSQHTRIDFENRGLLRCGKPFYAPTLNSNGQLVFCSYTISEEGNFSDISESGFKHAWNKKSSRLKRIRFQNNGGIRECTTCYFYSNHKPTITHQVPLQPMPDDIIIERPQTKSDFLQKIVQ